MMAQQPHVLALVGIVTGFLNVFKFPLNAFIYAWRVPEMQRALRLMLAATLGRNVLHSFDSSIDGSRYSQQANSENMTQIKAITILE